MRKIPPFLWNIDRDFFLGKKLSTRRRHIVKIISSSFLRLVALLAVDAADNCFDFDLGTFLNLDIICLDFFCFIL